MNPGTREEGEEVFNDEAPGNCWVECVGGYLRVMPPGDWIDYEGRVHYVQAGAPNVLTPEEARLLLKARDDSAMDSGAELDAVNELYRRLSTWAEEEGY